MGLGALVGRHRGLAGLAAGVLLTLAALAAVFFFVLANERRAGRLLAASASRALGREIQIDRATELSPGRIVLKGIRLPRRGGWPAEITAVEVEASGPLLAAAQGQPAPVTVVVRQPAVTLPGGPGAGGGLGALAGLREGLASVLAGSHRFDATLVGGTLQQGDARAEFDLTVRKLADGARLEVVVRGAAGPPLVLTLDAGLDGPTPDAAVLRLRVSGSGPLGALAGWLPAPVAALGRAGPLEIRLAGELPAGAAAVRGRVALGDTLVVEGDGTLGDGRLRATLRHVEADLGAVGGAAGLAWRPAGRAELGDVTLEWRPDEGGLPSIQGVFAVTGLGVPATALGAPVEAERIEGRLALQPGAAGGVLRVEAQVARLRAAGVEAAPATVRARIGLAPGGGLARVDLDELLLWVPGVAALRATGAYDGADRRLRARVEGGDVEAAALVRQLAPGWLGDADRLGLAGVTVTADDLDPVRLTGGRVRVDARGLALARPDGRLVAGPTTVRADLTPAGATVALDAERVRGTLPAFRGGLERVLGSARLGRRGGDALILEEAEAVARDPAGQEALTASLRPVAVGAARFAASVRAPALDRLATLWPDVARRVNGSARLDVELPGAGLGEVDGRLALRLAEADLLEGRISVRDVAADLPVRRAPEARGAPPWGVLEVGELLGYGVLVRDLRGAARIWADRLALDTLTYALYSGEGHGSAEVALEPAGLAARVRVAGDRVRIEEFIGTYGVRGGTMTGLLRYDLETRYQGERLTVTGRLDVPEGGAVNIELLNRLLAYAGSDPTGVVKSALENLRNFEYKSAEAEVRTPPDGDIRVTLGLRGRERFGIFPPRVREINVRGLPLSFLTRQFPGR